MRIVRPTTSKTKIATMMRAMASGPMNYSVP
jgi:hypothetical protein